MAARRRTPVRVVGCCKDCEPGSTRPVTRPGPRCATHQRERKARLRSANHATWILATYGITADEYEAIFEAQGGKCAICRRATGATRRLSVDHDHKTGEVRSLCCNTCNKFLGHIRDDPEAGQRVYLYLLEPPGREVLTDGRVRDSGMYAD